VAVVVDRQRAAPGGHDALQQEEVAVAILGLAEERRRHVVGGVVDRREERAARAALVEPGVWAGVELQEHPLLRVARAPPVVLRGLVPAGAGDPGGAQDAPQRRAGEFDPLPFGQQFAHVLVVAALVLALRQLDDPPPQRRGERVGRPAAVVAVDEARRALGLVGRTQATQLPQRDAQEHGGGRVRYLPLCDLREHRHLLLLLARHLLRPLCRPKGTFSLTRNTRNKGS
jgi:hypothetical protein